MKLSSFSSRDPSTAKQQYNSTAALQHDITAALQHCSTTALQDNSTIALQHGRTTALQHSITAVQQLTFLLIVFGKDNFNYDRESRKKIVAFELFLKKLFSSAKNRSIIFGNDIDLSSDRFLSSWQ